VDVSSFLHLLLFNASPLTGMAVVALALVAFVLLGRAWWQSSRCVPAPTSENWLWAATLCLTLVVNSYAPIYDTILLVPAAALAAGAMARGSGEEQEAFRG
jgi:hypothetical protein